MVMMVVLMMMMLHSYPSMAGYLSFSGKITRNYCLLQSCCFEKSTPIYTAKIISYFQHTFVRRPWLLRMYMYHMRSIVNGIAVMSISPRACMMNKTDIYLYMNCGVGFFGAQ
jgi:hypothetical protein